MPCCITGVGDVVLQMCGCCITGVWDVVLQVCGIGEWILYYRCGSRRDALL